MLSAIHFNHDHRFQTYKIEDVICEGMLPAKFEVSDLLAAQAIPEKFLCVGLMWAKATLQFWWEDRLASWSFPLHYRHRYCAPPSPFFPAPTLPFKGREISRPPL